MANIHGWVAPSVLLAGFLVLACVYWALPHETYIFLVKLLVDDAANIPFIDTHVFLAWAECHGRGIDVLVANPCDMLGRTLAQSPLWLLLSHVGANVGWTNVAGLLLGLGCIVSLFFLPPAPSARAAFIVAAAMWSPPVAFALERGNTDLLIFMCVVLGARLSLGSVASRNWGYATLLFAGLLKFYPLAALAIALKESPRWFWRVTALCVAATLLFVFIYRHDLPRIAVQTGNWFGLTFGAINLIAGLGSFGPGWDLGRSFIFLCCVAPGVGSAISVLRNPQISAAVNSLRPLDAACLLAGAGLMVGSFVSSMNGGYRAMFLLLTVVPLLRLAASGSGRIFKTALGVLLFVLWWFKLHLWVIDTGPVLGRFISSRVGSDVMELVASILVLTSWLVNQMAWWWFAAVMLALLVIYARSSPAGAALSRRPRDERPMVDGA